MARRQDEQPCGDPKVTQLADWQTDRERRERRILADGLAAAADALYDSVPQDQDVRIAIVAMYGDPDLAAQDPPEDHERAPVEARFISLDRARPLTDAQRRRLALETTRAASEPLFREMKLGLALADLLEDLAEAAEAGDDEAERRLAVIAAALNARDDERVAAPTPVRRTADEVDRTPSSTPHTAGSAGH
jgi:hypothetical protein